MSNNNYTYNVLIARFRDFVEGHYILKRFTHGQIADADLAKNNLYPWLHVVPEGVNFDQGTKSYNFSVMVADLPREKSEKNANQAEVISDCLQLFSDLIATIENGTLFGRDIVLATPINVEPFIQELSNSLTGVEASITITVDYNWDACDVPANYNPYTPLTGEPPSFGALQFNNSLNLDGASVTLDNDVEAPGVNYYYGTNTEGVKGWHTLPSGSSFTCDDVASCATIVGMQSNISDLETDKAAIADLASVAFSGDYNDLTNLPAQALTAPNLDSARSAELGNEYTVGDVVHYGGNIYRCLATNSGIAVTDPSYWQLIGPGYPTRQRVIDYAATTGDAQIINKPNLAAVATSGDYNDLINTPDLTGYGDMLKATYDTDNDGIVDAAKKEVVEVINKTGATLTKGTICYIKSTSSSGTHPEVLKADATTEATSSKTIGAIYEDIANDATGLLVTSGEVRNLDTSAYTTGALLYLSTTAGQVTTTPPAEPAHVVFIGHVTRAQNGNGRILYAIQNGYELTELHGVLCPTPTTGDVLKYDGSLWVNGTLAKADVGLGNVDNTSDINKPISTLTQAALDTKITTAKSFMHGLHGATVGASSTTYAIFGTPAFNAERARIFVVPNACTVSKMYVRIFAAQPATGSLVITLRKNGVDTSVVTIIAAGTALDSEANSGATSVTFAAGDDMSIKLVNNATTTSATVHNISIMVEI